MRIPCSLRLWCQRLPFCRLHRLVCGLMLELTIYILHSNYFPRYRPLLLFPPKSNTSDSNSNISRINVQNVFQVNATPCLFYSESRTMTSKMKSCYQILISFIRVINNTSDTRCNISRINQQNVVQVTSTL